MADQEPADNIEWVCPNCVPKKYPDKGKFDLATIGVGDYVKKQFNDGTHKEHMWVCVTEVTADGVRGELNNVPARLKNIKLGDKVVVKKEDIEDVLRR